MKKQLLYALSFACFGAFAAEFQIENDQLIISGILGNDSKAQFESLLINTPTIRQVVFRKCLGGQLGAAFFFARIIRDKGLDTILWEQSHSACAIAFLAGKHRGPIDRPGTHMLMLHSPRNMDGTPASAEIQMTSMSAIDKLTNGKIQGRIRSLITESSAAAAGVYIVHSNYKVFTRNRIYYCNGSEGRDVSKCQLLDEDDPYEIGIFTNK